MAADDKKGSEKKLVSEKQRFSYIGFDVFPGTPKDLFKSDAEKSKYVDAVLKKREKGDTLREECTLLEERVSSLDRIVLTVASLVIVGTLFIPWFSAYNVIKSETTQAVVEDTTPLAQNSDSLGLITEAQDEADTTAVAVATEEVVEESSPTLSSSGEEIKLSYVAKKKIHKEYSRLSGIGVFTSLGTVGSKVFSSGIILILTGVAILLMVLLSIGLPIYNLYGIYGLKGNADKRALEFKKIARYNWLPLILFVFSLVISFVGAQYGFSNPEQVFTSIGSSYSVGAFLGSFSYGILISQAAFILIAAKGMEI